MANGRWITKFDKNGAYITQLGTIALGYGGIIGDPNDVVLDNSGNLYVTDYMNGRIIKLDANGKVLLRITVNAYTGSPGYPYSVALDSVGNIYTTETSIGSVKKYDKNGTYLSSFGSRSTNGLQSGNGQFLGINTIRIDNQGNVLVSDYNATFDYVNVNPNADRVQIFDSNGNYLSQFGKTGRGNGQFFGASGMAIDNSGNAYVADTGNNRIQIFAPANASVYGVLAFDGIDLGAAAQNVTFTFRSNDGSADIVQSLAVPASGAFTLNGLFSNAGILHIKPDKYIAVNVPLDLSGGNLSGINAMPLAGDANNDNSVDSSDFGVLIGAFNTSASVPGSGYDATADFNGDDVVDSTDFGLLIGNFNSVGAP